MRGARIVRRSRHGAWIASITLLVCVATARSAHAVKPDAPTLRTDALLRGGAVHATAPQTSLLPRLRIDPLAQPATPGVTPASRSATRYALPMLLSAVVPGAGEISMGHWWRGLPLVAADVATWVGYAHYNGEGNDLRDQYQLFADQNWNEDRWQDSLTVTRFWDTSAPWNCNCSPPYIPPDEDLREYYENLGKYEQFFPGWEDWNRNYDPEDPQSLRRIYSDMRIESNNRLDSANRLIGVAALTRVVSVIQSFWLVRRESRSDGLRLEPVMLGRLGSGMRLVTNF